MGKQSGQFVTCGSLVRRSVPGQEGGAGGAVVPLPAELLDQFDRPVHRLLCRLNRTTHCVATWKAWASTLTPERLRGLGTVGPSASASEGVDGTEAGRGGSVVTHGEQSEHPWATPRRARSRRGRGPRR